MVVRTATRPATFAELHRRLGEIPLDRIRMDPAPGTATEADLLKARGRTCELIDGVLVEKPVGTRESLLGLYIGHVIVSHAEPDDLGVVLGSDGFIRVGPDQL